MWPFKKKVEVCEKFPDTKEWHYLDVGQQFQPGDEYGMPAFRFVIGSDSTGFKPGDKVQREIMCYHPRRRKP